MKVVGHTSRTGDAAANLALSQRRAALVKQTPGAAEQEPRHAHLERGRRREARSSSASAPTTCATRSIGGSSSAPSTAASAGARRVRAQRARLVAAGTHRLRCGPCGPPASCRSRAARSPRWRWAFCSPAAARRPSRPRIGRRARAPRRRPTATASAPTSRPTSPACPTPSRGSSRSAPAARTSRTRCSAATTCRSTRDSAFSERGLASWYGKKFHGRRTANGEIYDMYAMTAAHPTLPLPSYARIRNPANGREVVVRINDRGPFHAGRIVDLSYAAALRLDLLRGVAPVELERLTFDEIRAGAWRRGDAEATRLAERDARRAVRRRRTPRPRRCRAGARARRTPSFRSRRSPAESAEELRPRRPLRSSASIAPAAVPAAAAPPRARLLGAARRVSRVGRRRELPAPGRRRGRVAGCRCSRPSATRPCTASRPGPMPSRAEAQGAAARVRDALGLVPVIVERR